MKTFKSKNKDTDTFQSNNKSIRHLGYLEIQLSKMRPISEKKLLKLIE